MVPRGGLSEVSVRALPEGWSARGALLVETLFFCAGSARKAVAPHRPRSPHDHPFETVNLVAWDRSTLLADT